MSSDLVTINCEQCTFTITQANTETIYCPACNHIFENTDNTRQVLANLEKAYEEIPHTFIKARSIYLKGTINGIEMLFLLDTGAEISLLPENLIEACKLNKILDKEFKGTIKGVGQANIIGRLHYVDLLLECGVYPCSFTVTNNNDLPPIIGINMMLNLGITIDFLKKKIHFPNTCSVDFISK
jgi:hypothetical protein